MSWQDIVIASCQLAFLPSMLPTIFGRDRPALSTSIMNAVIVAIITLTMSTLHLWFSVVTGIITTLIWLTLAIQKYGSKDKVTSK